MSKPQEKQKCARCGKTKTLRAFRRHHLGPKGRETVCKACRKKAYRKRNARRFGRLPDTEGSEEWMKEIRRRAAVIRAEKEQ